ncbi:MAG: hypothetical protein ABIA04_09035 [Pseudomonadota bacterium]
MKKNIIICVIIFISLILNSSFLLAQNSEITCKDTEILKCINTDLGEVCDCKDKASIPETRAKAKSSIQGNAAFSVQRGLENYTCNLNQAAGYDCVYIADAEETSLSVIMDNNKGTVSFNGKIENTEGVEALTIKTSDKDSSVSVTVNGKMTTLTVNIETGRGNDNISVDGNALFYIDGGNGTNQLTCYQSNMHLVKSKNVAFFCDGDPENCIEYPTPVPTVSKVLEFPGGNIDATFSFASRYFLICTNGTNCNQVYASLNDDIFTGDDSGVVASYDVVQDKLTISME